MVDVAFLQPNALPVPEARASVPAYGSAMKRKSTAAFLMTLPLDPSDRNSGSLSGVLIRCISQP